LVNIAFGVGIASVPMIAIASGAGLRDRALQIAWTAGLLGAGVLGAIGLVVTLVPEAWSSLFSDVPAVLRAADEYLVHSGWGYAFFGLGLCLFFASQGLGHVTGTVLAGTLRLLVTIAGAWWIAKQQGSIGDVFTLVAAAMIVYGMAAAIAIRLRSGSCDAIESGHADRRA
jgi:Na+-driven multidrug efflux pump